MSTVKASASDSSIGVTRISVVVPSYNHAQFVSTTLRSIMKQTLAPAELVVIDDGSTDDSPRVIEEALKECPFPCELIVRSNRGLCATLNEGLARTKGDYFAYLGSDDLWLPDFLKERVHLLQARSNAVLAYGHAYLIDDQNQIIDSTADWAPYKDGNVREMLLRTIAPMSPSVVYRRSALEQESWNEQARLEDYDLYLRLSVMGEFAFDPQVLAAWRQHSRNTSRDQMFMLEEQLRAQRAVMAKLALTESELKRIQTKTRFQHAENFIRMGDKQTAIRLMTNNMAGVSSARALGRMVIKLSVPTWIMHKWKDSKNQRKNKRYGSIEL